jgi:poly(3-hydroxybutyrate) depolymerase
VSNLDLRRCSFDNRPADQHAAAGMRGSFFALAMIVLAAMPARAMSDIAFEPIKVDGADRSYYLYIPNSATIAPAPLLVLLHGSMQNGLPMARLWKDFADDNGIVLVAPNALHEDGWRPVQDSPQFILAVLQAVQAMAPINMHRIYLFGQSGGAVYALTLSMLESEFFAATAIHAGAWRHEREFMPLAFAKRKIPLAIIVGDRDEFFSLHAVRNTEDALRKAGIPVEVSVIADQHHWYDERTAPDINRRAWDFLSPKTLDQPPRFVQYGTGSGK